MRRLRRGRAVRKGERAVQRLCDALDLLLLYGCELRPKGVVLLVVPVVCQGQGQCPCGAAARRCS